MEKEYLFPVAVTFGEGLTGGEYLTKKSDLQITIVEPETAELKNGGFVVLDFGKEVCGALRILAVHADCKVRIRLGESVGEVCSDMPVGGDKGDYAKRGCNDHSTRDGEFFLPFLSDNEYMNSGFRYARIDAVDGEIKLKSVTAACVKPDFGRVGYFKCEDETVNRIFETAARTVTLCMQNGMIWDGIKRDRLVWVGDMYPEIIAATDLFRDLSNIRRAIEFTRETTPLPQWMNTMPAYSLWWIICLKEYAFRSGDESILAESEQYLHGLIAQIDGYVDDGGEITGIGLFLDWPSHDTPDERKGVDALLKLAADAADAIFGHLGSTDERLIALRGKIAKNKSEPSEKKQAIALSLSAGRGGNADKLTEGGAKGMSTFMSWAILCAAHDFADKRKAADMCKEYYGAMLDLGATTFWEDFDTDWLTGKVAPITRLPEKGEKSIHADFGKYCYCGFRHSLCHGWSAGVIDYLFTRILGVKRVGFGGSAVSIEPYAAFGDMEGVVPIGGGKVTVRVHGGKVTVEKSDNVEIIVQRC